MNGQAAKKKKIFDGRYEILSIVGRGARSVVYHAKHVSSPHSEVALKVLIDQKGKNPSAERLRREALAMVSCRHRYVARLDDFHSVGSLCYLSMEFAAESDLRNFIKKHNGKLSIEQAERFLKQCAEGLAFIHRAGIVHRDIKPENILVMNDKEVRITDFGVALLPGEECSIADLQSGVGTMNYMAPEILEGKAADQRSDIYALGVVFYEMLSGKNPFVGAPLAKQIDIRKTEGYQSLNELDSTIPKYLSDLIAQSMRYDSENRFTNADQLLASLINQKSDNFEKEQKVQRPKPTRPKTNNIHKRSRKPTVTKVAKEESEDLFAEFDRLISEESSSPAAPVSNAVESTQEVDFGSEPEPFGSNVEPEQAKSEQAQESPSVEESISGEEQVDDEVILEEPVNEQSESIQSEESEIENLADQISAEPEFDNGFDEELSQDESREYSPMPQHKVQNGGSLKKFAIIAISILIFGLIILPSFRKTLLGSVGSSLSSLNFWKSEEIELPTFEAQSLVFPNLAQGVYSGSISGVIPGKTSPLTMISFGVQGKIVILVGIDGWAPVILDKLTFSDDQKKKSMKISSNGVVLDLKGAASDNKILGTFTNLINGTNGEWSVEPAT